MTVTCKIELGVFKTDTRFPLDKFLCTIVFFLLLILSPPDLCACLCTNVFRKTLF